MFVSTPKTVHHLLSATPLGHILLKGKIRYLSLYVQFPADGGVQQNFAGRMNQRGRTGLKGPLTAFKEDCEGPIPREIFQKLTGELVSERLHFLPV